MAAPQFSEPEFIPPGNGDALGHQSEFEDLESARIRRSTSRDRGRGRSGSNLRSQSRRPQIRAGYMSDGEVPISTQSADSFRYHKRIGLRDDEYQNTPQHDAQAQTQRGSAEYYRDHQEMRHPDLYSRRAARNRPPRAYLNRPVQDEGDSPSKPFTVEETKAHRVSRFQDEEMGFPPQSGRFNWRELSDEEKAEVLRLPWTQWMNSDFKNHFVTSFGEFVGTTLFLLFAFAGTEVANIQSRAGQNNSSDSNTTTGGTTGFDVSVLLYISLSFGFSLMVNVWIFFRISGGLFNPAVTLAMVIVKAITPTRAGCLFLSQMLGSILASVIVRFLFPETFNVRTTLSGGTSIVQGVFIEAILTSELIFTIFMLAKEKHRATFIAPVGIGLALFIAEMVGVQFTGGSLNPARSFGPCVITLTFDPEHWIYWVGPIIGALIAILFYKFIKTLEYEVSWET